MSGPCCAQLHVHSSYSFYDGQELPEGLVAEAASKGMPGMGLTDHGVIYGAPALFKACKKHSIKGVIGCEVYEAVPASFDPENPAHTDVFKCSWAELGGRMRYFHLTLWVLNEIGWQNLCQIHTLSHTEAYLWKNKPLVDRATLAAHSEGLLVGLGCVASRMNVDLAQGGHDLTAAYETAKFYADTFPGRCVMEVMANTSDQQALIRSQRKLAQKLGVPILADNDVHYRKQEHGRLNGPHHVLVQARRFRNANVEVSGDKSDEGYGQWYGSDGFYMKDGAEMLATGGFLPTEIEFSCELLDRVDFDFSAVPAPKPPIPSIPQPGDDPLYDAFLAGAA